MVVYANALAGDFVWDDRFLILDNPRVHSFARLGELFSSDYVFVAESDLAYGYFRPLSSVSLALDWTIWGENPFGFHLSNALLHAGASLLAAWLALALGLSRAAAWAVGLLFAVHPIHVESVAWISGRTDVLAFLGAAGSLALYLRAVAREDQGRSATAARAASLALFAAGLLAKEMAAVVPLWIGAVAALKEPGMPLVARLRRAVLAAGPWIAVLVAYAVVRFALLGIAGPEAPPGHDLGRALLTAVPTVVRYLGWMAFPVRLSAYAQNPYVTRALDPRLWLSVLVLVAIAAVILRLAHRRPPAALVGLLLLLSFAPILNFVRASGPADMGAVMAERFAYLPSFPFLLLVALAAEAAIGRLRSGSARRAVAIAAVVAITTPLAAKTLARNRDWKDDLTFFGGEASRTRSAPLLWANLAGAQFRAGNRAAAERALAEAERLAPNEPWVLARRAQSLALAGRYGEAIPIQERVVAKERESNAMVRNNLAYLYRVTGDEERALDLLRPIVERLPDYADPWLNLAEIDRARGDADAAIASYRRVLEIRPVELRAVEPLATLLAGRGEADEAETIYLAAISGGAEDAKIWNNVAALRLASGEPAAALEAIDHALAIDPAAPRTRFNRARLLEILGRKAEAFAAYRGLARLPGDGEVSAAAAAALEKAEAREDPRR